jgi:hypothetical protein
MTQLWNIRQVLKDEKQLIQAVKLVVDLGLIGQQTTIGTRYYHKEQEGVSFSCQATLYRREGLVG